MGRFIQIAMGPGAELPTHCLLARDLKFLEEQTYRSLDVPVSEEMRML
jgi:hypothetical protein